MARTNVQPVTAFEWELIQKVKRANQSPGTLTKRFIRDLSEGSSLSDDGRRFLAFIAHRFRRQYVLTPEQIEWIGVWNSKPLIVSTEAQ